MLRPARRRGLHWRIRCVTDEDKASMAKASLPLLPSLLMHAVVLAACFFHPCTAQPQSRTENISAIEAAVRARAFELLRDTASTGQLVDLPLESVPELAERMDVTQRGLTRAEPPLRGHVQPCRSQSDLAEALQRACRWPPSPEVLRHRCGCPGTQPPSHP